MSGPPLKPDSEPEPGPPQDGPRRTVHVSPDQLANGRPGANSDDLHMEWDEPPPVPPGGHSHPSSAITVNWPESPDPPTPQPLPRAWGTQGEFGKYRILNEIGRGGMGVVYKARHQELDQIVAIKMILASHLATDDQVRRFYDEARAAARLRSPHIVGIHDVGEIHGQHYIAMDYMPGPSLADLIRRGTVDPIQAAQYVCAVARVVAELHDRGVVHRDLKPSNVLLDASGRPCVTDFGLAKSLHTDGRMTRTGAIVGTPGYMAPEQAAGKDQDVGPHSDIYSLGAILFELLSGRPPFLGETPLETIVQVLEGEPPRLRRLRPEIPRPLERICAKCLERQPSDRYPSAEALADDLDRYLRSEPIEAGRAGFWTIVRRWARREPALVSRLGTMGICGGVIQANHFLIEEFPYRVYRNSLTIVIAWAVVSVIAQKLQTRERGSDLVRYLWAAADVFFYTLLVLIHRGLGTALVAGYFLVIIASGLWFRERLVWTTTGLCVLGYGALAWHERLRGSQPQSLYQYIVFATALVVSGLITGYQVRRVRALSQYYEHRPLP